MRVIPGELPSGPGVRVPRSCSATTGHGLLTNFAHINVLEMLACDIALESDFPVGAAAVTLPWHTDSMVRASGCAEGVLWLQALGGAFGERSEQVRVRAGAWHGPGSNSCCIGVQHSRQAF